MPRSTWETLSWDQAVVLRAAAARSTGKFDGTYGIETIQRFLHSSDDQFADRATLTKFLMRPVAVVIAAGFGPLTPVDVVPTIRIDDGELARHHQVSVGRQD